MFPPLALGEGRGIISDFFGRKRCLVTVNILMGLSNLFVIFAGANWATLCIAACCFGFSYGAVWALYAAVAGDFSPIGATGSVIGVWGFFAGIVLILGPPFGGYVADVAGLSFGLSS